MRALLNDILVHSVGRNFDNTKDALVIFEHLRNFYSDDSLFLLESLSGPEKDCTKSLIAFDPLFSVSVNGNVLTFSGIDSVCEKVKNHPALSVFDIKDCKIQLEGNGALTRCLRAIESIFKVTNENIKSEISFGFFGYYGYDACFYFEEIDKKIPKNNNLSTIILSIYRGVIELDFKSKSTSLVINKSPSFTDFDCKHVLDSLTSDKPLPKPLQVCPASQVIPSVSKDLYEQWFKKAKHHIDKGDIYQIQLGHEIQIKSEITPFDVYLRLREKNPSPYMYFFKTTEGIYVIGASPELFASLTKSRELTMRPIAGTVRNSSNPTIRESNRLQLVNDEKEKAEHLMLVDLCRNDIAICATPESLEVDQLMVTEDYSHVIHLVSNVKGQLRQGKDKYDVMAATFPAGTMTGTPKIRAIEIIEDTEISRRTIYAGCIGYWGINDTILTALCIRTATYHDGVYFIRASGGIVEDSTAYGEWHETINKLSSTFLAITDKELINENFVN